MRQRREKCRELGLPILRQENRTRLRDRRSAVLLLVTSAVTVLMTLCFLHAMPHGDLFARDGLSAWAATTAIARHLLLTLMMVQAVLCALIVPALAAGAISREREAGRFELLLLTRLSTANLVWSKLFSTVSFAALLVWCAFPAATIAFMLGGVSPGQAWWALGVLLAMLFNLTAVGLCCSAYGKSTAVATAVTYVLVFVQVFLLPACALLASEVRSTLYDLSLGALICWLLMPVGAVLATLILRAPVALAVKRATSWGFNIVLLMVFLLFFSALCAVITQFFPAECAALGELASEYPEYVLLGNPLAAIVHQLDGWSIIWPDWIYVPWTLRYYTPLAVAIQVGSAGLFLAFTIRRIDRQRRGR